MEANLISKLVVVGSIVIDYVACVDRLPQKGETLMGSSFHRYFGGKGANQATQAALLYPKTALDTPKVAMIGCIGHDTDGEDFIRRFERYNIDHSAIKIHDNKENDIVKTGCSLINVDIHGENTIAYVPGANALLSIDFLMTNEVQRLLTSAEILVSENGINSRCVCKAFEIAKRANKGQVKTIFTPAPTKDIVPELYKYVDFLILNEGEATMIANEYKSVPDSIEGNTSGCNLDYLKALAISLRSTLIRQSVDDACETHGMLNIIITNGSSPYIICVADSAKDSAEHASICFEVDLAVQIPQSRVIDTVGAGDSFVGAFSVFLQYGLDIADVVKKASYVASQSVTRRGVSASYFSRDELPDALFQNL